MHSSRQKLFHTFNVNDHQQQVISHAEDRYYSSYYGDQSSLNIQNGAADKQDSPLSSFYDRSSIDHYATLTPSEKKDRELSGMYTCILCSLFSSLDWRL